ncbi:MAG: hypothetical protein KDD92_18170 [Caldilineaceae bacterium]|nr:hypothetical protein [Caldilineaceae bacterium]
MRFSFINPLRPSVILATVFVMLGMATIAFSFSSILHANTEATSALVPLGNIQAVTAGSGHACALTTDGGVFCWGDNTYGQLGDDTRVNRPTPVAVAGLNSGVIMISAGRDHTCALKESGELLCWGKNDDGQIGDNTLTDRRTPAAVYGLGAGVQAIAAGGEFTCALVTDGGLKCWGQNFDGQLGIGSTEDRKVPTDVSGLSSGVVNLTAGGEHACALTAQGDVKCWGANLHGQLGDGSFQGRLLPIDVTGLGNDTAKVVAAQWHTCAISDAGLLKCWGRNNAGQLGDGTTSGRNAPVDVLDLDNPVFTVAGGAQHTCAVTTNNVVYCWGDSDYGQLGNGTTHQISTPAPIVGIDSSVTNLTAGRNHVCAVTIVGNVKCWGDNQANQLGNDTVINRNYPTEVDGLDEGIVRIDAGDFHTCGVTDSGGVRCWGRNEYGQLGDGTQQDRLNPVQVTGLQSGITSVSLGAQHSCALTEAGGVICWGDNAYGQLGSGTTVSSNSPVSVVGLGAGIAAVSAGRFHTCALTNSGAVKCWGDNSDGQLGTGNTVSSNVPVNVIGLESEVRQISAGDNHTCVIFLHDGYNYTYSDRVKCWGNNSNGQLGDGTTNNRSAPVDVIGIGDEGYVERLSTISLSSGSRHNCLDSQVTYYGEDLQTTVECWGWNAYGQLGNDSFSDSWTSVFALSTGSDGWFGGDVASGFGHTCVNLASVTIRCWGWNEYGQLGDGTWLNHRKANGADGAYIVAGEIYASVIAAGARHTCAIIQDYERERILCWGSNEFYQLGAMPTWHAIPIDVLIEADGIQCYALALSHQGDGSDPEASPAQSAGCPTGEFIDGQAISLLADPAAGWHVARWTGTDYDAGTDLSNSLTMPRRDASASVTYELKPITYTLTTSTAGSGSLTVTPDQTRYDAGTEVTLTAAPASGWSFAGWSGDLTGTDNPVSLVMDENKSVTATFIEQSPCYTLQLLAEGEGATPVASPLNSDDCNDGAYHAGEDISLQAAPATGWEIAGWSGTQNNASTSVQNTLQMPSNAHTAGVRYTRIDMGDSSSSSYLPLVKGQSPAVPPPAFPSLVNGDFDVPGDTTWRENTTYDRTIIVSQTYVGSLVQGDFLAHSPPNLAWLGGQVNERATLSQNISLPDGIADIRLAFYHWIGSQDNACGADRAYVNINGSPVIPPLELCYGENTGGWAYREIDLSSYAGQDIELTFLAEQDGEGKSNWFLDNIVLCDGAAAHPCQ